MEGIMLTTIPSHPLHKGTLDNELSCRNSHCWHLNPRRKTQGNQHPSPCYQVGEGDSKGLRLNQVVPSTTHQPGEENASSVPHCYSVLLVSKWKTLRANSDASICCLLLLLFSKRSWKKKKKEQFSFKIRMFSLFGSSGFFFFSSQKIGKWFWRGKAKTCLLLNISYTLCSAQLHTVRYRTGRNPTVHKATQCGTGGKKLKERQERSFLN